MTTTNSLNLKANSGAPFIDYREFVTFTPTISGSTVAGAGTYTTQFGRYTKIGNMVFINVNITWTAHTGTGNMLLTGLPFTVRNQASYVPTGAVINLISAPYPAATVSIVGQFTLNTTQMALLASRSNNTNLNVAMDAAATIQVSGFYIT